MFRLATENDWAAIVAIHNQAIATRRITAQLTPLTVAARRDWFELHQQPRYPLWVYENAGAVGAWCSYSPFYGLPAYAAAVEISIYLDEALQGQGLGKQCLQFLMAQMPELEVKYLIAFVFASNQASLKLLRGAGFRDGGMLPQIADMETHHEDLCLLYYRRAEE